MENDILAEQISVQVERLVYSLLRLGRKGAVAATVGDLAKRLARLRTFEQNAQWFASLVVSNERLYRRLQELVESGEDNDYTQVEEDDRCPSSPS